jgi:hypothetical protein
MPLIGRNIKLAEVVVICSVALQAIGFLIWEVYLFCLGYVENNILQARFILTGLLFCLVSLVVYAAVYGVVFVLFKLLNFFVGYFNKKIPTPNLKDPFLLIYIGFFWFLFYSVFLFSYIPLLIGGGQPHLLSLVTNDDGLKILKSLNIQQGTGAQYQLENACVAYENNEQIIILRNDRILSLSLKGANIIGLVSLPGAVNLIYEPQCQILARDWVAIGYSTVLQNMRSEWSIFVSHSYRVQWPQ